MNLWLPLMKKYLWQLPKVCDRVLSFLLLSGLCTKLLSERLQGILDQVLDFCSFELFPIVCLRQSAIFPWHVGWRRKDGEVYSGTGN